MYLPYFESITKLFLIILDFEDHTMEIEREGTFEMESNFH